MNRDYNQKIDMNKKVIPDILDTKSEFHTYSKFLINNANEFGGGTRPDVVGQVSYLHEECPHDSYDGWKEWYLEQEDVDNFDESVEIIQEKLEDFKNALDNITEDMIRSWVEELVYIKTPTGLNYEKSIMKELSNKYNLEYTNSTADEESKNIDGYIGEQPISIKPYSHKNSSAERKNNIEHPIVYYKATDNYLYLYYDEKEFDFCT